MTGAGVRGAGARRAAFIAARSAQAGVTLIEVLVAMALIATVFIAIIAGMLTTAKVSGSVNRSTMTESALSGVTERITSMAYTPCDGHGEPTAADLTAKYNAWTDRYVPRGVTVQVVSVSYWNATSFGTSCVTDGGAHLLSIKVTAGGGDATAVGQVVVRDPEARPTS